MSGFFIIVVKMFRIPVTGGLVRYTYHLPATVGHAVVHIPIGTDGEMLVYTLDRESVPQIPPLLWIGFVRHRLDPHTSLPIGVGG